MNSPGLETSDSLRVYENILEAIGKTPLVRLSRIGQGLPGPLYAKIEPIVQAPQATYPAHTSLEEVFPEIVSGNVIIVTKGDHPVGILTKIDVLDFISQEL